MNLFLTPTEVASGKCTDYERENNNHKTENNKHGITLQYLAHKAQNPWLHAAKNNEMEIFYQMVQEFKISKQLSDITEQRFIKVSSKQ